MSQILSLPHISQRPPMNPPIRNPLLPLNPQHIINSIQLLILRPFLVTRLSQIVNSFNFAYLIG
jgi:hypothetical protein